jgi:hypothetical protein
MLDASVFALWGEVIMFGFGNITYDDTVDPDFDDFTDMSEEDLLLFKELEAELEEK